MSEADARVDPYEELHALIRAFRTHLEWQRRAGTYAAVATPTARPAGVDALPGGDDDAPGRAESVVSEAPGSAPAPADAAVASAIDKGDLRAALAEALGETAPAPRTSPAPAPAPPSGSGSLASSGNFDRPVEEPAVQSRRLPLAEVRATLGDCQRCKLSRTRKNIVFGDGDPDAALMFIGEAPGAREDERGLPFVGPAGQLLDRMITAMGWTRDTVYIANVLKCRPPGNRNPDADEVAACRPFLADQIAAVAPRIIVTLGRPAAHLVLETTAPMHALRGSFRDYRGIKVMPTFHPAYLLRKPEHKRQAWADLKLVIAELERLGVGSPRPPKG